MGSQIRNVVILGGGTSGWLTAGVLQQVLNPRNTPDAPKFTLIESSDIGIIGVGEATVPSLANTMKLIDVTEREFMRGCDGTFKSAIRFVDWKDASSGDYYYHPFEFPPLPAGLSTADFWTFVDPADQRGRYDYRVSPQPAMCDALIAPKAFEAEAYGGPFRYAYHIDTVKLGRFVRSKVVPRGIRHITDTVVQVNRLENGDVRSLMTKENGEIEGDLFIDCSGFKGMLIHETLGVPRDSANEYLLNDRAVAVQAPYPAGSPGAPPYTIATARAGGWIWDIGLSQRRGVGYVFSSAFSTDEGAEAELRRYLGATADGLSVKFIPMRVGCSRAPWQGNVVSIGLAAAFIEPLESSGIWLTEVGIMQLAHLFPSGGITETIRNRYNAIIGSCFREVRDFIVLHFMLTQREDTPYWRAIRHETPIPDSLRDRLELWKHRSPTPNDIDDRKVIFDHNSYTFILHGMGRYPVAPYPHEKLLALQAPHYKKALEAVRSNEAKGLKFLPKHAEFIRRLHE